MTSGQDGGISKYTLPSCTTKKKDNDKFKNKKQPELTENQTVWKPNNQVVKEETFIHTGRRGRDGQLADKNHDKGMAGGLGWAAVAEQVVLYLHVDKPGGTTGE